MTKQKLLIEIDAPQEEWDEFLAEFEAAEVRLAKLEIEARQLAEPAEPMLPSWLQRVMESFD